ncbi:cation diffusion facilitator CzcD-associated flavoprotein CzcO [Microbacteriaceae bacterium SG_E_30_P1]|uniref:Cation diffusion facilitator CzcD-associated flavoprotein CzcO n=1 Tax=Antiquaquibacter oligotrophicus TaxID=2880260 RepID=A0ABT6KRH2_9MICO|nr:NAD(P)/FAD-dependent oxidoreductase [Antiquaquibacter oligotrophicus]MDH6182579.1 cation diffusion facilitator CzcD-associated flavoprotein CzcO [Antiquaquibacter oligotrophicus]UDF14454.1 NAD(P)/FAD-dependent oxidoreductase [Antiquaquibacter oligotrophicus]
MTHVRVAIVGAGFAGLGAAHELLRSGESSFVVLERAASVGGTWRDNTYPGVACDVPSHLYSFSFLPNPAWTNVFARGEEIHGYLRGAANGLESHLRLNTAMTALRWDDEWAVWRVSTSRGDLTADAVILAAGRLTEPRIPEVAGIETFTGDMMHTARWRHDVDLTGKRVAVVGTGASAVQVVPEVAAAAASVTVFQRSAPWIVPRPDREYTESELAEFASDPTAIERLRTAQFWEGEAMFAARAGDPAAIAAARQEALEHLHSQVTDARLRAALTPNYEIGCKRRLISSDYYPAFESGAVHLEASALERIDHGVLVAASGERYDADVVIFATGFESSEQPYAALVEGVGGVTLAEHWADGMTAFASTTVHGFPNLFIVNGPNAGLGHNSAVYMIETQLQYVVGALEHLDGVLEVSADAEREYTAELDRRAASTVWLSGCDSWYLDSRSGRLTLLWPGSAQEFRERNGVFDAAPYREVREMEPRVQREVRASVDWPLSVGW